MRTYENIIRTSALFDGPVTYSQTKRSNGAVYLEKIFRRLLVYDQLPDNDLESVMNEAHYSLQMPDPAFEVLFRDNFERYIQNQQHFSKWEKIRKDYKFYLDSETRRREKNSPYHPANVIDKKAWEDLPNFGRMKRYQPWQYDLLYREAQYLAGEIFELVKHCKPDDKDVFRLRINSILVADKIIFALDQSNALSDFVENELNIANIKISLDGYKLSLIFLNRVTESLHKIGWSKPEQQALIQEAIQFAGRLSEKIKARTKELERLFMLFMDSLSSFGEE